MKTNIIATMALLLSLSANANQDSELISKVLVKEIKTTNQTFSENLPYSSCDANLDAKTAYSSLSSSEKNSIGTIINVAKKTWQFIIDNKPVLNLTQNTASALPKGIPWATLECWQVPVTKTYEVTYINGLQMEVASLQLQVRYTYGGSYKQNGRYLKHVTIIPAKINVLWGYRMDAAITIPSTVNVGPLNAPIAGMEIQIDWAISTIMKISTRNLSFFVNGVGDFHELKSN